GIQSYNIYKESTQAGVYYLIGNIPVDSMSHFIDSLSNPLQQAWRYKISVVDSCGNESELSVAHKTMHLTINEGLGNINLIWDHYQGFNFLTYYIYRYTTSTGWQIIDSIASNLTSRTDFSPPMGSLSYQVVVKHPDGCEATVKTKDYNSSKSNTTSIALSGGTLTAATTTNDATQGNCDGEATVTPGGGVPPYTYLWDDPLVQTNSIATGLCPGSYSVIVTDNIGDSITVSVTVSELIGIKDPQGFQNLADLKVYPNPSRGVFTLEIECIKCIEGIKIFNILGKEIYKSAIVDSKSEIDMSAYPKGIYNLLIITKESIGNKRIIIE
ncbi:MAG: T9SS type A sorting domain-containing protein, partial [Bacteroidota bacterium]